MLVCVRTKQSTCAFALLQRRKHFRFVIKLNAAMMTFHNLTEQLSFNLSFALDVRARIRDLHSDHENLLYIAMQLLSRVSFFVNGTVLFSFLFFICFFIY